MTSLTGRLVRAADDLRELRIDLHNLALLLLQDEAGLSHDALTTLDMVFQRVGGLAAIDAIERDDGRFYIPPNGTGVTCGICMMSAPVLPTCDCPIRAARGTRNPGTASGCPQIGQSASAIDYTECGACAGATSAPCGCACEVNN